MILELLGIIKATEIARGILSTPMPVPMKSLTPQQSRNLRRAIDEAEYRKFAHRYYGEDCDEARLRWDNRQ